MAARPARSARRSDPGPRRVARGRPALRRAYLYVAAVGLTLGAIDLQVHRLPNALTLPSYPIAVALLGTATLLGSHSGSFSHALLGGAGRYLCCLLLCLVNPSGMGFGDVKLARILGLYTGRLGWAAWTVGLASGFLYAGSAGLLLLASRRIDRKAKMAMGPFLLAGAITGIPRRSAARRHAPRIGSGALTTLPRLQSSASKAAGQPAECPPSRRRVHHDVSR